MPRYQEVPSLFMDPQCPGTPGLNSSVLEVPGLPVLTSSRKGGPEGEENGEDDDDDVTVVMTGICIMRSI